MPDDPKDPIVAIYDQWQGVPFLAGDLPVHEIILQLLAPAAQPRGLEAVTRGPKPHRQAPCHAFHHHRLAWARRLDTSGPLSRNRNPGSLEDDFSRDRQGEPLKVRHRNGPVWFRAEQNHVPVVHGLLPRQTHGLPGRAVPHERQKPLGLVEADEPVAGQLLQRASCDP
jgi:hypothetical protein